MSVYLLLDLRSRIDSHLSAGSASDIGSGLDVSSVKLVRRYAKRYASTGLDLLLLTTNLAGSFLGGAGTIDLQNRYHAFGTVIR